MNPHEIIAQRAQIVLRSVGVTAQVKATDTGYIVRWVRDGAHYEKLAPPSNLVLWRAVATVVNEWGNRGRINAPVFI